MTDSTHSEADTHSHRAGRLDWNIKTSFRAYVQALSDGTEQWLSETGALTPDALSFDLSDASEFDRQSGQGILRFSGAVRFRGYRGALLVTLSDPELKFAGEQISVSFNVAPPGSVADRALFATAALPRPVVSGAEMLWRVPSPRLTAEGGMLLGSVYPESSELDEFQCVVV